MNGTLPDWAVSQIVDRAGRGITEGDREQIVRSVSEAASFAFDQIKNVGMEAMGEHSRPSVLYRPALSIDGDQWCALYGANLQDGVAGFGKSPADAMWDFDRNWATKLALAPRPDSPAPVAGAVSGQGGET